MKELATLEDLVEDPFLNPSAAGQIMAPKDI